MVINANHKGWTKKSIEKLLASIEKSKIISFSKLLFALNIPGLGAYKAQIVANQIQKPETLLLHLLNNTYGDYFLSLKSIKVLGKVLF